MTVTDPIADLLTRIRNAQMANKSLTVAPYSKIKEDICKVLKSSNFIEDYSVEKNGKFSELSITFANEYPSLELKRVSRPGQRIYIKHSEIPRIKNGMGIGIMSTPKGIMSTREAKKIQLGGELLCTIS
ncbi:MAG: 30S ribosomal protein S8 [Candidatus Peregrinibacteria bacterium]|nr:30S ribosomal protein S8 [Candidatus Peregrinibacteria bacterium]MDZ4245417.1 30S ribosomal protein S8 [Candidatus Gracilibacteria bacterium]